MNLRMDASWENLDSDAKYKADGYFHRAVDTIDEKLGGGYAAKHPDLIAAFMRACSEDNTATLAFIAAQEFGHSHIASAIEETLPNAFSGLESISAIASEVAHLGKATKMVADAIDEH